MLAVLAWVALASGQAAAPGRLELVLGRPGLERAMEPAPLAPPLIRPAPRGTSSRRVVSRTFVEPVLTPERRKAPAKPEACDALCRAITVPLFWVAAQAAASAAGATYVAPTQASRDTPIGIAAEAAPLFGFWPLP